MRRKRARARFVARRTTQDNGLPASGTGTRAEDVTAPVRDLTRHLTRLGPGRGGRDGRRGGRGGGGRAPSRAARTNGRRCRSGNACEREQQPAGQYGTPQFVNPLVVDCKSEAERAERRPGRAPLGAAYAIVVPRVATDATLVRR